MTFKELAANAKDQAEDCRYRSNDTTAFAHKENSAYWAKQAEGWDRAAARYEAMA